MIFQISHLHWENPNFLWNLKDLSEKDRQTNHIPKTFLIKIIETYSEKFVLGQFC